MRPQDAETSLEPREAVPRAPAGCDTGRHPRQGGPPKHGPGWHGPRHRRVSGERSRVEPMELSAARLWAGSLPWRCRCWSTSASSRSCSFAARTLCSSRIWPSGLGLIQNPGVHGLDQRIPADEIHLHGQDAEQEVAIGSKLSHEDSPQDVCGLASDEGSASIEPPGRRPSKSTPILTGTESTNYLFAQGAVAERLP